MSKLFKLDLSDFFNGLIIAVLGNVVFYLLVIFGELYKLALNGDPFQISINWNTILVIAVFSALTYLSKRFVSDSAGNVLGDK